MASFKLTNKAVEDLNKIWIYTFENWSELRADKYYHTLLNSCKEIASNPGKGKKYPGILEGLFGYKTNSHIIFYRDLSNGLIEITRILHERMDLKGRISEL